MLLSFCHCCHKTPVSFQWAWSCWEVLVPSPRPHRKRLCCATISFPTGYYLVWLLDSSGAWRGGSALICWGSVVHLRHWSREAIWQLCPGCGRREQSGGHRRATTACCTVGLQHKVVDCVAIQLTNNNCLFLIGYCFHAELPRTHAIAIWAVESEGMQENFAGFFGMSASMLTLKLQWIFFNNNKKR